MSAPRALITGGTGFIGLHLARELVTRGWQVTLADNGFRSAVDADVQALLRTGAATHLQCDLTRPTELDKLGGGYDHVYHLAAIVGVRFADEMPERVLRTNLLSTINVLDWMPRSGANKLLFSSTSETYAATVDRGLAPVPTPEDVLLSVGDGRAPRYSYGLSKIAGEMLVAASARRDGYRTVAVRLHNVYGPRMGYEHVIPQLLERIYAREDPFRVFGAHQRRAFCYVDDAVAATISLMENADAVASVVNVGNDTETEIRSLVQDLFELTGHRAELLELPAPHGSVARRCPDLTRLRSLIGRSVLVTLQDGLRETEAWYRAHQGTTAPG